jgi:hypothetical protein
MMLSSNPPAIAASTSKGSGEGLGGASVAAVSMGVPSVGTAPGTAAMVTPSPLRLRRSTALNEAGSAAAPGARFSVTTSVSPERAKP